MISIKKSAKTEFPKINRKGGQELPHLYHICPKQLSHNYPTLSNLFLLQKFSGGGRRGRDHWCSKPPITNSPPPPLLVTSRIIPVPIIAYFIINAHSITITLILTFHLSDIQNVICKSFKTGSLPLSQ